MAIRKRFPTRIDESVIDIDSLRPDRADDDGRYLLAYVANVINAVESASDEAQAVIGWLSSNRQRLALPDHLFTADDAHRGERRRNCRPIGKARWRTLTDSVVEQIVNPAATVPAHRLEPGFASVIAALDFDPLDAALFRIALSYKVDHRFERFYDIVSCARGGSSNLRRSPDLLALLINGDAHTINTRFRADAPLIASGALRVDNDGYIQVAERLLGLVHACAIGNSDVRAELLGAPLAAKLPWTAFRHLGPEIDIARALLGAAIASAPTASAERGVHVLLYGPPGTGKTECATSLAATLGVPLYSLGERGEAGTEPDRSERLSELLLAQRIGVNQPALYLFDEAEDLFRARDTAREPDPKIFIHRLLETARVPIIWAANELDAFSSAVLRRMTQCIEIRLPPQARRAELWQELAIEEGVSLDAPTARNLARLIPAAPSVARTALRATRLAKGDAATAELVATGMARAINHGHMPAPELDLDPQYDPALSNTDADLTALAARLAQPGAARAVSFLLSGPPGTGKSAFARYLAQRMGLPVLQKRGSDLFGPYVGQTEANIAGAFAEARASQAFLIFDEADSLLRNRAAAQRNWEASQVNEMLTWMEHHALPFACTTNLPEQLDQASLRRFLIHLKFAPLRADQAATLFERAFAQPAPTNLARLDRLTPADFTRVARRVRLLGLPTDPTSLLTALTAEQEGRLGTHRPIGFAGAQ